MLDFTKTINRNKLIAAIVALLVLVVAVVLLLVFIFGSSEKDKLFEVKSVDVLFNGDEEFGDIEIGSVDGVFSVVVNGGEDISKFDVPQITWGFVGESYDNSIDGDGKFSVGNMLGDVSVVVTVKSRNEISVGVSIKIVAKSGFILQSISVKEPPKRVGFIEGEVFDSTGLVVQASFIHNGGEYKANVSEYMINAPLKLTPDCSGIEINFTHERVTRFTNIPIAVNAKSLQSIEITSTAKTDYVEGQAFDKSKLEVTAHYEYVSLVVSNLVTISVDDVLTMQTTKVKISFVDGDVSKVIELHLKVTQRVLQSLDVNSDNVRLEYTQGDIFDSSRLVVNAKYEYMDRELDSDEYEILGNQRLLATDDEVIVRYTENSVTKQVSIPIVVHEPYEETRIIVFVSENPIDVSLSWRYEYLANNGEQLQIDNVNNEFEVPYGAAVVLTAHNPSIMRVFVDGEEHLLTNEIRTMSFVCLSDGDIEVEFNEMPGIRTTVRFVDIDNDIRYITNLLSNATNISTKDIYEIQSRFFENSPNFSNSYYIDGVSYTMTQMKSMNFYSNTTVNVVRKSVTQTLVV